jgi:hypothetical protein
MIKLPEMPFRDHTGSTPNGFSDSFIGGPMISPPNIVAEHRLTIPFSKPTTKMSTYYPPQVFQFRGAGRKYLARFRDTIMVRFSHWIPRIHRADI